MTSVVGERVSADNSIATVHRSAFGKIELVRCSGANAMPVHSDVATHLHFSLPIVGSFVWHADHEDVFAAPNSVLCTSEGERFRISHPHGGDESLVFTPNSNALANLSERAEKSGIARGRRTVLASSRAQLLAYSLCFDVATSRDALSVDENLLTFFESLALAEDSPRPSRDEALVRRTLEYVHHCGEPAVTLKSIAAAMEVRAAYLTHVFMHHMGLPLYRYVLRLKLVRALHRIATSDDDLTQIALDLGFNSHSHLSSAFKARYGIAPSTLRIRSGRERTTSLSPSQLELRWRPLCAARGGLPN